MDILREALMHAMQALSQLSYGPDTRKLLYFKAKLNLIRQIDGEKRNPVRKMRSREYQELELVSTKCRGPHPLPRHRNGRREDRPRIA